MIKGWYARSENGGREGVSTKEEEEAAVGGGKHTPPFPQEPSPTEEVVVCASGGTSERATVVERDCLRASTRQTGPLASARHPFTHAYSFALSLFLSFYLSTSHLSLVVADVTRRYILLNE